jgi:hypothetical protein
MGDADPQATRSQGGKQAIIVTASLTDPIAESIESQPGDQSRSDGRGRNLHDGLGIRLWDSPVAKNDLVQPMDAINLDGFGLWSDSGKRQRVSSFDPRLKE